VLVLFQIQSQSHTLFSITLIIFGLSLIFVSPRLSSIGYELLMFFVYDAFDCVLRLLVIQLTLLLLHPIVGHSIDSYPEFRSIDLDLLNHSIDLFLCDHSIVSSSWNHSIASVNMSVTTRSMTKCLLYSDIVRQSATSTPCDTALMNESVLSVSSLDRGPYQVFEESSWKTCWKAMR
jgi:hypothetical protein